MEKALRFLLFLISLSSYFTAISQKTNGKISGTIYSDSSKQPIVSASISLINLKDSTVEKMVVSDKKGNFNFNDLKLVGYELQVTAINHFAYSKVAKLTDQQTSIHFDSLIMKFTSDSLMAVTVTSYKPAIIIKTDTTEFNAGSFKVKENAMVEDLLKKLPGIELSKSGTIKAQGETVTQVYVDGKPFFSDDPKAVTQNLPANIIDKVQIIDKKSDEAQVTKVEDGVHEKIINITIKKDKKKGVFGRVYAGYGTADRYEGKINANYFNQEKKVSLVVGSNNTGRNDYSSDEDDASSYNNYSGITKDFQAKLTYVNRLNKKLFVNGNISYGNNTNTTEQIRNRQNIIGDSTNFYFDKSTSERSRSGINSYVSFDFKPDTLTQIQFNETANFSKNVYNTNSVFNSRLISDKKINEGIRTNTSSSKSPSFSGNLTISRRFKKQRRGLFFNFNSNINTSLSDGFNISNNYFFPVNSIDYQLLLNQFINNDNKSSSFNSSLSYNEPISKRSSLNVSTSYGYNNNNTIRETFDFNNASGNYDIINDTLTNNFKNANYNTSVGANYSYSLKKGNISLGSTWQDSKTQSRLITKDSFYLQHFSGFVPYMNINFSNKGKRFGLNYVFSNRAPQAYQLQPVIDNSNPLYTRLGNPNLKYSTNHRVNFNLNAYNSKKETSIYTSISLSLTANSISNSTVYDNVTGRQITQPINVNGVYNVNSNFNYSKPVKIFGDTITWSNNGSFGTGRNVSLLNNEKNINNNINGRISSGLDVEIGENFEFDIRTQVTVQNTNYSLKPDLNSTYYTYGGQYSIEANIGKLTEIKISGDLTNNSGRSAGFNQSIHMINADVTQYLNTQKSWWLKLKVYDLLKQNVSIYRYSGESYIEDVQTNVLTRFFLVSLNYKLSKFGSKK